MAKRAAAEELRDLQPTWRKVLSEAASPSERDGIRGRILRPYVETLRGAHDPAMRHEIVDAMLALHRIEPLGREIVESLVEIADDRVDWDMMRRALEALLPEIGDDEKARALVRLGDALHELGEEGSAAQRWKAAAARGEDPERLYERVLEVTPGDAEAADALVKIHLATSAWDRVPEIVGTLLHADAKRGTDLLLGLEKRALESGEAAIGPFLSMIDEAVALGASTSETTQRLRRAAARALATQPSRHDDASTAYRMLLDTFESKDDIREYETFIGTRTNDAAKLGDRRWLFEWRVARARGDQAAPLLRQWAREEEEHGSLAQAASVREQLLEVALDAERPKVRLALSELYVRLGRYDDAAAALAPILGIEPKANELVKRFLAEEAARARVIDRLEALAGNADDETAARIFDALLGAREETAAMPDARRRWYRRATGIAPASPPPAVAIADAKASPEDVAIWETAETVARKHGKLDAVVAAYVEVLARPDLDATLAETLGKRFLSLETEHAVDAGALADTLEHVLARVPYARWALDRVKVALGAQGSWERLFASYDRAIDAARSDDEKGTLLDEAMFVARDLANDTARTTKYLAAIHDRRPDDHAVTAALERLYERQGNRSALIVLLDELAAKAEGEARRELSRRLAALLLDAGKTDEARQVLRGLLDERPAIDDVVELFERLADPAFSDRLRDHYEATGRMDDAVRIVRATLAHAQNDRRRRARGVRDLVRLGAYVTSDVGDDRTLRKVALRAKLVSALAAWKRGQANAGEVAWTTIGALKQLALEAGDAREAVRLLERAARLRFATPRRRELESEAALLWSDRLNDSKKAMRIYGDLFREEGADDVANAAFERYAALLESAGESAKLARLWETRAKAAADREQEAAAWVRAGSIWETVDGHEDPRRAIDAFRRAADLDAVAGHEGLARLYLATWRWREATIELEWLLERSTDDHARRAVQLANAYVETGASDRARTLLRGLLPLLGDPADAATVRARLLDLYRRDESWAELADALAEEYRLVEAADVRVAKLNDRAGAIALLDRAIERAPDDVTLRPKLADLLEADGAWGRVADTLAKQIELTGDRGTPREAAAQRQRLARAYLRVDPARPDDALAHLRAAAKLQPTDAAILLDLGRLAFDAGDLDSAERAYRTLLLSSHGARVGIYIELVAIAAKRGDIERATNLLESALDAAGERDGDAAARAATTRDLAEAFRAHVATNVELAARIRAQADGLVAELENATDAPWPALCATYAALGDEKALLAIVRRHVEALPPGPERARVRVQIASLIGGAAATEHLRLAVADDPTNEEAVTRLSKVLEEEGRFEDLASVLKPKLDSLPPGDARWMDTAWRLGRAQESAEQWKQAAQLYESILDRRPTDPATARTLAYRLEAIESERLVDALEHWIAVDPAAAHAVAPRIVELREAAGDRVGLARALEAVLVADPADPKYLERYINLEEQSGNRVAVAAALRRAHQAKRDDLLLLRRLVEAQRAVGEERENLALLDAAIDAANEQDSMLLCLRARVKEALGDDDGAVADLRGMGHADSDLTNERIAILRRLLSWKAPPAADDLAMMLVDDLVFAGHSADVDTELQAVLGRNPEHAGALFRYGALYVARKEWQRAKETYEKLLGVVERTSRDDHEKLARVAVALATACIRSNHAADAKAPLERVFRLAPEQSDVGDMLEQICELTHDRRRLAELIAARAARTERISERAILLLDAAKLLSDAGDRGAALETTEAARELDPGNVDVALACGEAYLADGRFAQAIEVLGETIERNQKKRIPAMASANFALARAYLARDELVEALDALKAAFAIDVRTGELALLLGELALDLGDSKMAERAFVAVTFASRMKMDDSDASVPSSMKSTALYHLASMAQQKGDLVTAKRWASKAVIEDASHVKARALLDALA